MGIIFGFILVCMALCAFPLPMLANYLLSFFLGKGAGLARAWVWAGVHLIPAVITTWVLYKFMISARGGTPDMELVWRVLIGINMVFYAIGWLMGR